MIAVAVILIFLAFSFMLVAFGIGVGRNAKARECARDEAQQEVWDSIRKLTATAEQPDVSAFTMSHAIDAVIVARIKLFKLGGSA